MTNVCAFNRCGEPAVTNTDAWEHPVCLSHFVMLGQPKCEPQWEPVIETMKFSPRVFTYRNTHQPVGA